MSDWRAQQAKREAEKAAREKAEREAKEASIRAIAAQKHSDGYLASTGEEGGLTREQLEQKRREAEQEAKRVQERAAAEARERRRQDAEEQQALMQAQREAKEKKQRELQALEAKIARERAEQAVRDRADDAELAKRMQEDWYSKTPEQARAEVERAAAEEALKDGNACMICRQHLRDTGPFVKKDGRAYHKHCLRCARCGKNCGPSTIAIIDGAWVGICCAAVQGSTASARPIGEISVAGADAQLGTATAAPRFCAECGATRRPEAKFCGECGHGF